MSTMTKKEPKQDQQQIDLFSLGCLVNLKIGMWSARKMLTRSDLIKVGYDPDKLPEDVVNLGRKLMVPKAEIQTLTQIEQRARKAVDRWSVPFGISNAHFVPINMLPTVEQQISELRKEFFVRVDSFISRFDSIVEKVKTAHPDFWDKCLKNSYPASTKQLRQKFQFNWFTFRIAGMGSIKETSVAEMIAQQKVEKEREGELRNQMKNEVEQFVGEYVTSMREETMRFCDLMNARINGKPFADEENSKKLTPKSITCFRNYIDRFRSMNIFGDGEVDKMLSEFKDTFLGSGMCPKDFKNSNIKTSISNALQTIRKKASLEGESGSKFIGELKRRVTL